MKISKEEFRDFYQENLQALLQEFDSKIDKFKKNREPLKRKYNVLSLITFICIATLAVLINKRNEDISVGTGILALLTAGFFQYKRVGISMEWTDLGKNIQASYKKNIIGRMCQEYFDDFRYIPHQHISRKSIQKSLLYDYYMKFTSGEDYFHFIIDGVSVQFSEFTYSNGKQPVFYNSLFVSSSFPKPFKGKTVIIPERQASAGINNRSIKGRLVDPVKELEKVQLETSDFEDDFIVRSNSQVESRMILSTSLMQKLVDYRRNKKRNISISFMDNRMYIRIEGNRDFFEPNFGNKNNADINFIYNELSLIMDITDIVEELSLNHKIWKV